MTSWRIVSNYHAFGLAYTVRHESERIRRTMWVNPALRRRIALVTVRTALVQSINNGSFYHGA